AALRALLGDRLVPQYEIALGVLRASVKHLAAFGTAFNEFAATPGLRAWHSDGLGLDVFALRIVAAGSKRTESAVFNNKLCFLALRAGFIERNVGLLGSPTAAGDLSRCLAFRISSASQELSEAATLERHRLAAVF